MPCRPVRPDARPLAALAASVWALGVLGVLPVWAGLPHQVALPPLDLFADVRVLLAEAGSYPVFVAGLVAAIGVRAVVLAAVVGALGRDAVVRALRFYAVAAVPALAAGALAFAGVAAVYSLFLWAGAAVALVGTVVLAPVPWAPRRRRGRVRLVVLGYLVTLLALSLVSALAGDAVRLAAVWGSAALTVLAARAAVGEGQRPAGARRGRPRRAAGALLGAVLAAWPPAWMPGASSPDHPAAVAQAGIPDVSGSTRAPASLFLVPGVGGATGASAMFRLDPAELGFTCGQTTYFSYAGPGAGTTRAGARCPITRGEPYSDVDTRRPLDELAASFRAQLAAVEPPVVVVAHSQGGWVAAAAIDAATAPSVEAVVLLGAFPRHRGGFVLDGTGAGVVGTDALEGLVAALRAGGATSFDPRGALARELLGVPAAIDDLMRRAFPPPTRVVTVTSAFDLPAMPRRWQLAGAADLCPRYVHHGDLPVDGGVLRDVRGALAGGPAPSCPWSRRWPTQAFTAFGVPGA